MVIIINILMFPKNECYNVVAVGSTSDCRSRSRKFKSHIIFVEINQNIISNIIPSILLKFKKEGQFLYVHKY